MCSGDDQHSLTLLPHFVDIPQLKKGSSKNWYTPPEQTQGLQKLCSLRQLHYKKRNIPDLTLCTCMFLNALLHLKEKKTSSGPLMLVTKKER